MTCLHVRRRTARALEVVGTLTCVWALTVLLIASAMHYQYGARDE